MLLSLLLTAMLLFTMGIYREHFGHGKGMVIKAAAVGNTSAAITQEIFCTCTKRCSLYESEETCKVCMGDYKKCTYQNPNVKITITVPEGWHTDTAKVNVSVRDTVKTGNFIVQSIEAKIGENGAWTDITEEKTLEITENCSVYVMVTDQKGNTYEKSRHIICFDREKPTLNAAVSNGLLSIDARDTDSGVKEIYINGYKFTNLTDGKLFVRLQKFDAGYEYFNIQAVDQAGNLSETYQTANPYYSHSDSEEEEKAAESLPDDAETTSPASAFATITDYLLTDSEGSVISNSSKKKKTVVSKDSNTKEAAREFYTIKTKSGKVFYLIVDKEKETEGDVYFLTEISENDLLNVTENNSETLPKNSAALESALSIDNQEEAFANNHKEKMEKEEQEKETGEPKEEEKTEKVLQKTAKGNPIGVYLFLGIVAFAAILFYWKGYRKKNEDFEEEDFEELEEEEEMEEEETEEELPLDEKKEEFEKEEFEEE